VKEAATILVKWWDSMRGLHEKYGDSLDIESKPEWHDMLQLQAAWMALVSNHTGATENQIFDVVQDVLPAVRNGRAFTPMLEEEAVLILRVTLEVTNQVISHSKLRERKLLN